MTTEDKKQLIEQYLNAYNSFDIDGIIKLISDDIEFTNISNGEVNAFAKGKEEFQVLAEKGKSIFSSRRQSITHFEDSSKVTKIDIWYRAKLAIDLTNGMKSGEELNLKGLTEFTFNEGKIHSIKDIS